MVLYSMAEYVFCFPVYYISYLCVAMLKVCTQNRVQTMDPCEP